MGFAANAEAALAQVAKRCTAGRACRRAFPSWRRQLSELVRRFDAHPARNRNGETISGAGLAGVIQSMLLDASNAASIPLVVSRTAAGDFRPLNQQINSSGPTLQLMFWSIWCKRALAGAGRERPGPPEA